MAADTERTDTSGIEERLERLGHYSRFSRGGLGVIFTAFILAAVVLVPQNTDSLAGAIDVLLMPLIFIGMGLLLFSIGMHLHLMHLNLVRQLRKEPDMDDTSMNGDEGS